MMDRPDYPAMVARIKPYLRNEQLYMRHVQFHNDAPLTAFDAPISAILFLNPRKDMDSVQKDATVTEVLETQTKKIDSAVWGPAEEDVNETILVIGRKDVEVGSLHFCICLYMCLMWILAAR